MLFVTAVLFSLNVTLAAVTVFAVVSDHGRADAVVPSGVRPRLRRRCAIASPTCSHICRRASPACASSPRTTGPGTMSSSTATSSATTAGPTTTPRGSARSTVRHRGHRRRRPGADPARRREHGAARQVSRSASWPPSSCTSPHSSRPSSRWCSCTTPTSRARPRCASCASCCRPRPPSPSTPDADELPPLRGRDQPRTRDVRLRARPACAAAMSTSRSARARRSPSWAPPAPASPRSPSSSPASTIPTTGACCSTVTTFGA